MTERRAGRLVDPLAASIGAYEITCLLAAFVELGIAERLARGGVGSGQLALELGLDRPALDRALRALASLRVVELADDGSTWSLTRRGERLTRDAPGSLGPLARAPAQPWWWASWGALAEALRTGRSGYSIAHGGDLYEMLATDEAAADVYAGYLGAFDRPAFEECARAFDWGSAGSVVDVGGGDGSLVRVLLEQHPHLSAVVADQPAVASVAQARLAEAGLADRARAVGVDFFDSVPPGADVYVLARVLHDWDDASAGRILATIRDALPEHGTLLVFQDAVDDDPGRTAPLASVLIDLALLVLTGGAERPIAAYTALLDEAGFALADVRQLSPSTRMLVARLPGGVATPPGR